jgi:hypothetical protein
MSCVPDQRGKDASAVHRLDKNVWEGDSIFVGTSQSKDSQLPGQ